MKSTNIGDLDMLKAIFQKQSDLQKKLEVTMDQPYITNMSMALMQEVHEALRETPWKPWKKQQTFNHENYLKELADALHFFVNLCLADGITPDMLFDAYMEKNKENVVRKETNY